MNRTVELTTMCCLKNKNGEILMIDRVNNWKGLAFPGGHLECNESITDCVIREIKEETNLVINTLNFKGMTYFINKQTGSQHIIFNYFSDNYSGEFISTNREGELRWIALQNLDFHELAEGMELRLDLFLKSGITEMYVEWDEENGYTKVQKTKIA